VACHLGFGAENALVGGQESRNKDRESYREGVEYKIKNEGGSVE